MIWNDHGHQESKKTLAEYISAEIGSLRSESAGYSLELARAITNFIGKDHDLSCLSSAYLSLLISRSLWAVGDADGACRFISRKGNEYGFSKAYEEIAVAHDVSLPVWKHFLVSRAVRPTNSVCRPRNPLWILDLRRCVDDAHSCLELSMQRIINSLLDKIACVFDRSKGQGALGLLYLDITLCAMLGGSRKSARHLKLRAEIHDRCLAKLRRLRLERKWVYLPDLLDLDL